MQSSRLSLIALLSLALPGCKDSKPAQPPTTPTLAPAQRPMVGAEEAQSARPKLVRAEPLPKVACLALRKRMLSHGDNTENLLWAALMLDFESTDGIAAMISKGPNLARPQPDDLQSINAMLPPEFFTLQEQLDTAIDGLRAAAKAKDGAAVAAQYGKAVETCISCHSLFLQFPGPE